MTSITARNAAALKARNGSTLPDTPAPKKVVAKGNKAVAEGKDQAAEAVAPSNKVAPTPVKCHCGCGADANLGRMYLPGHDARHAGAVARANIEGKAGAQEALELLPPKLKAKAARMIANAAAKAEKAARAKQIREAAAAALKAELAAL
jgi:hypothetical protein